jgi:hypothetical protein
MMRRRSIHELVTLPGSIALLSVNAIAQLPASQTSQGPDAAGIVLDTLISDRPTVDMLSFELPVLSVLQDDAAATIEYRESPGGPWMHGVDLLRLRPQYSAGAANRNEGFAGAIWDLSPGTTTTSELP